MLNFLLTIIVFGFILGILVFIHEFGHFIAGKIVGVKVEEFAFGMGKMLFGKKVGETLYRINLFPIGGYCKFLGEEERAKDPRSFSEKSLSARAFIIANGVIMNFLLASVVFYIYLFVTSFVAAVPNLAGYKFIGADVGGGVIVSSVAEDSPAEEIGLEEFNLVVAVDEEKVDNPEELVGLIKANAGQEMTLKWLDTKGVLREETFRLREEAPEDKGLLGVGMYGNKFYLLWYEGGNRIFSGFLHSVNMLGYSVVALGDLIATSFRTGDFRPVSESVSGVVGSFAVTSYFVEVRSIPDILSLIGLMNISLVFVNLLPIPALDGGHLLFAIIEKVRGRRISEKYEEWAVRIGFIVLIALMILITLKDLWQFNVIGGAWSWIRGLFTK